MKNLLDDRWPFNPRTWPFFYGYWIVLCSAVGIVFSAPGQTVGVSVFTDHLIKNLSISRLQISTAYMVGTLTSSFFIGYAGRLLDTVGIRPVAAGSSLGLGLILIYLSQVDHLTNFFSGGNGTACHSIIALVVVTLGFAFLRFFGQGVMTLAGRTMLIKWFVEKRGRMNAFVGVFVSITFSGSPLLFEFLIERYTWRGAWIILGIVISCLITVFTLLFYRDKPEKVGLLPDGTPHEVHEESPAEEINFTLREARKTYLFWIYNLGISMFSLIITAVMFHIVSIFKVNSLPRIDAISIFLPGSVIAVCLHMIVGWLSDFTSLKYYLLLILAGLALSLSGILCLGESYGRYMIIAGNGIASGMFGTLSSVTWPRFFGRKHLGAVSGFNMQFLVFFSAVGPFIFGWSFDATGNYTVTIIICLAIVALLFAGALFSNESKHFINKIARDKAVPPREG